MNTIFKYCFILIKSQTKILLIVCIWCKQNIYSLFNRNAINIKDGYVPFFICYFLIEDRSNFDIENRLSSSYAVTYNDKNITWTRCIVIIL